MVPICFLLFFSGFAALTYEILWLRHLGLIFGNTVYAAATVMTAYMIGLAVGAHFAGKWAERLQRPIRFFGMLEMGIGIYALFVPLLFAAIHTLHIFAYQNISESLSFLTFLRFVLTILLLLIPTCFMGATLPVLSHGLLRQWERFGARLGLLYGTNTMGAVAGTLFCGFLLIPGLGLTTTNILAIGINAAVGISAWLLSASLDRPEQSLRTESHGSRGHYWSTQAGVLLIAAGMSGFISLGFEIVWFRALILVFGSTTYSFSAMLSVFLIGIALGSMLLSWMADRIKMAVTLFCIALIGIGIYSLASLYWFTAMPEMMLGYLMKTSLTWPNMLTAKFGLAVVFLLLPTMLFGVAFASAAKAVREILPSSSRTVGLVYTTNTVGAAAGAVFVGFILLPAVGMETSLIVLSFLALVLGTALALAHTGSIQRKSVFALIPTICLAVIFLHPPNWDKQVLAAGPYFSPWSFIRDGRVIFSQLLKSKRLLFYKEGKTATVSVSKFPDEKLRFSINGKIEADTTRRSMTLQRMMGHLPMLFHPNPRHVLNIGLGAGVTFGALGCYPVDHLEVVEIEPEVRNVAEIWGKYNHRIIDDPRAIITINDGRNHLAVTSRKYDVITSDPFEPVMAGAANLYTVEHFRLAKSCLAEEGIMAQYLPLYELSKKDFLTIMRSFVHVFPNSLLFYTGWDTILLGFKDKTGMDSTAVKVKFEITPVRESLKELGFTRPEIILGMFVSDLSKDQTMFGPGPLNTDDHPVIEFSAPKSILHYTPDINQHVLKNHFSDIPEELVHGFSDIERTTITKGHEALEKTLSANILRGMIKNENDVQKIFDLLFDAAKQAPENPVVRNELVKALINSANTLKRSGLLKQAFVQYQIALQYQPDDFWGLFHLSDIALRTQQTVYAKRWIDQGLRFYPESPLFIALHGRYKGRKGDIEGGWEDVRAALDALPQKWDF